MSRRIASEEELIARYLAPLASGLAGARGLQDDCATLAHAPGEELVLTTDAVAEGVHFLADDTPEDVAWKALAVNVSDLAGKGASPLAYLMALAFPDAPEEAWLARFVAGLQAAQDEFGLALAGGDTDRRPGPMSITITAIGKVPVKGMVARTTARPGDRIFVSGTLGDAALGLALRRQPALAQSWLLDEPECRWLLERYARPAPRLALRPALLAYASAAMDISDGVAKDLRRMCRSSGCGASVQTSGLPLSAPARKVVAADSNRVISAALSGGDDYELLVAIPEVAAQKFSREAALAGTPVHEIGHMVEGGGIIFRGEDGRALELDRTGWDHFSGTGV